jgi:hypothetical protein
MPEALEAMPEALEAMPEALEGGAGSIVNRKYTIEIYLSMS